MSVEQGEPGDVLYLALLALIVLISASGCGYGHHNKSGKTNTSGGY